jgi:hypothetical protein
MTEEQVDPSSTSAPDLDELRSWTGHRLDDLSGARVGRVEGAYVSEPGGRPEWLLARMGRFGHHCLVPARDAVGAAGHVWVPYTREQIRAAPQIEPGAELDRAVEGELRSHYGLAGGGAAEPNADVDPDAVAARPAAPAA